MVGVGTYVAAAAGMEAAAWTEGAREPGTETGTEAWTGARRSCLLGKRKDSEPRIGRCGAVEGARAGVTTGRVAVAGARTRAETKGAAGDGGVTLQHLQCLLMRPP